MFNVAYDLDVVGETVYYKWNTIDAVKEGKGNAVAATKAFFDWLQSADVESDEEGGGSGNIDSRTAAS